MEERGKPLKAYAVTEEGEGTGGIVFARHAVVARREGANEYGDGEFELVSCRRAPWADAYAGTDGVPVSVMVDNGWHFECGSCGRRIDNDMLWENDLLPEDVIGTQHTTAYCNERCEARDKLDRAEAKHRERRWIRRFEKIVLRRFPDASIMKDGGRFCRPHAYAKRSKDGVWRIEQVVVSFTWPGQEIGPASLRVDTKTDWPRFGGKAVTKREKPYWTCCAGDREAFEAYAKATARLKDDANA